MDKFSRIKAYLLGDGNYDFPFDKYIESVRLATGETVHPFVWYSEYFYDDPTYPDSDEKITYENFAKLIKSSPDFNPNDKYIWFGADGKLHSTNCIFPDLYDVDKVAAWCVEHNDDLDWDDTIHEILFGGGTDNED